MLYSFCACFYLALVFYFTYSLVECCTREYTITSDTLQSLLRHRHFMTPQSDVTSVGHMVCFCPVSNIHSDSCLIAPWHATQSILLAAELGFFGALQRHPFVMKTSETSVALGIFITIMGCATAAPNIFG